MKKYIILLLMILMTPLIITNAKIEGADQFFTNITAKKGSLIPNESYLLYCSTSTNNIQVTIRFYDKNNNLITTETPQNSLDQVHEYVVDNYTYSGDYYKCATFKVDNNSSEIWSLKNVTNNSNNYIVDVTPYELKDNQEIIAFNELVNTKNNQILSTMLKDGDIFLFYSDELVYREASFDYEDYYFSMNKTKLNYFKAGYEYDNQNNKIEDDLDFYRIKGYYSGSEGLSYSLTEYKNPKFRIECDNTTLNQGEETTCTLYEKSIYNINLYSINPTEYLNTNSEVTPGEDVVLKKENDKIVLYEKEYYEKIQDPNSSSNYDLDYFNAYVLSETKEIELLKFKVKIDENFSEEKLIDTIRIDYKIGDFFSKTIPDYQINIITKSSSNTNSQKPKKVINPETRDGILLAITLFVTALGILIVNRLRKNNIVSKI